MRLAQLAKELGYRRVWYAEHHNIPTIASSATAVLIAHMAAHTPRPEETPFYRIIKTHYAYPARLSLSPASKPKADHALIRRAGVYSS